MGDVFVQKSKHDVTDALRYWLSLKIKLPSHPEFDISTTMHIDRSMTPAQQFLQLAKLFSFDSERYGSED